MRIRWSARAVSRAVGSAVAVSALVACYVPPSPESLACWRGCAREKDQCLLAATNAPAVTHCDRVSRRCGEQCNP